MPIALSEFHYTRLFIDGTCLRSIAAMHGELSLKLGLPLWYGRNWDALRDCLSTIGDKRTNVCASWNWVSGKRLILFIHNFSAETAADNTLLPFLQIVAQANDSLAKSKSLNRIWVEFSESPA